MWSHGLQHIRLPYPSLSPWVCWTQVHWLGDPPTISSSVAHFSSCLQSFPASESFPMSQFFVSGGQSIGASASVLPMNIQGWFPLGLTGLISLPSKGFSRVFSNTAVQKHQFFGAQLSLWSNSHICMWLLKNHSFDYTDFCRNDNVMLLSPKREGNSDTCYSTDEPWGHDAEWNKPSQRDRFHVIPLIWGNCSDRIHRDGENGGCGRGVVLQWEQCFSFLRRQELCG